MRRIRAGLLVSAAAGLTVSLNFMLFTGAAVSQRTSPRQGLAAWEQVYLCV